MMLARGALSTSSWCGTVFRFLLNHQILTRLATTSHPPDTSHYCNIAVQNRHYQSSLYKTCGILITRGSGNDAYTTAPIHSSIVLPASLHKGMANIDMYTPIPSWPHPRKVVIGVSILRRIAAISWAGTWPGKYRGPISTSKPVNPECTSSCSRFNW